MGTEWIEEVMRMNEFIVEAETRRIKQLAKLLTMASEDQDTVEDEGLLTSYGQTLVCLRAVQTVILRNALRHE